jgi:transposase
MLTEVVYSRCAGLDVHKKKVVACLLIWSAQGEVARETRSFETMKPGLERLAEWLLEAGCTHVAMEATGVYWKPVYNVLEGRFELLVVNAEHIKAIAGRKTDVKDAEWIATLLQHGLLKGSFIPDRAQRELRELTRYRTNLIRDRAREVNRLQKTLEGANIKLSSVLTDITGVSGQKILEALVAGESAPESLADLAHWRVQKKRSALEEALMGKLEGVLRFMVGQHLSRLSELERHIEECDQEVAEQMRPFEPELERLQSIPGMGSRTAQVILAEIGSSVSRFASHRQLAAWAGMCPGNRESAGRQRAAPMRQGSPWLKSALTEASWAAGRGRQGYLVAQFNRLAARRGRKRAIVAVAHSILVIVYHLLARGTTYVDIGSNYFDDRDRVALERRAVQRLEKLGYQVHLERLPQVA